MFVCMFYVLSPAYGHCFMKKESLCMFASDVEPVGRRSIMLHFVLAACFVGGSKFVLSDEMEYIGSNGARPNNFHKFNSFFNRSKWKSIFKIHVCTRTVMTKKSFYFSIDDDSALRWPAAKVNCKRKTVIVEKPITVIFNAAKQQPHTTKFNIIFVPAQDRQFIN